MPAPAPSLENVTLQSNWDGLNEHLLASFFVVKKTDKGQWVRDDKSKFVVRAPVTDMSCDIGLTWNSPFEQTTPDGKFPTLSALLQSGSINTGDGSVGKTFGSIVGQFTGRTGITKMNSTQVFNGMPPVKIQATVLFRAWRDAAEEVEKPFDKLMEWALPVNLSQDGPILGALNGKAPKTPVEAAMPSEAPIQIAMVYKNRTYSPLVIENISPPLNSNVDEKGRYIELLVPMTLCTLTAIDRADWAGMQTMKL